MAKIALYNDLVFITGCNKSIANHVSKKLSDLAIKISRSSRDMSGGITAFFLDKPFSSQQHRDAVSDVFYDEGYTVGGCWLAASKENKKDQTHEFLQSVCDIFEANEFGKFDADDLSVEIELADDASCEVSISVYAEDEELAYIDSKDEAHALTGRGTDVCGAMNDYLNFAADANKCKEFATVCEYDSGINADEGTKLERGGHDALAEIKAIIGSYYNDMNIGIVITVAKLAFKPEFKYAISLAGPDGAVGFVIGGKTLIPASYAYSIEEAASHFVGILNRMIIKKYKMVTGIK
jgi:hypothetical protein